MKSFNLTYTLIMLFSILFISCDDDDLRIDSQKPFIELHSPEEGAHYLPGDEIELRAYFSDNLELGSYKIDIHYGGDGHHHSRTTGSQDDHPHDSEGTQWEYSQSDQIEAGLREYNITESIIIPTEINHELIQEGTYHVGIFLLDKAGNQQIAFAEIYVGEHEH